MAVFILWSPDPPVYLQVLSSHGNPGNAAAQKGHSLTLMEPLPSRGKRQAVNKEMSEIYSMTEGD